MEKCSIMASALSGEPKYTAAELLKEGEEDEDDENSLAGKEAEG